MLNKHEWLTTFVTELMALTQGALDHEGRLVRAAALQQWERLADENPRLVAQRWVARNGLRGAPGTEVPPSMLIWISECAEELERQQPFLGRHVVQALALLQWDMHGHMAPTEAALHWLASRPARAMLN